jgi:choline dehydrogenase
LRKFDYVVVGAGTAGCAVAARLSDDPTTSVLLLEAGGADVHPYIRMPLGFLQALRKPALTWGYETEAEPHLGGRRLPVPRGRVLGGSSSINGMVHFRGHPADFDEWADLGCDGWGYRDVLPYFKRSETHWTGGNQWRGANGPIHVRQIEASRFMQAELRQAAMRLGYADSSDYDGELNEGFAPVQVAITGKGRRSSSARAYLAPARERTNLVVRTGALARRVILEKERAVGVEFEVGGQVESVEAEREVILSGGVYNSPKLLMLSGIGPADELRALGIAVGTDLPGVGKNISEHVRMSLQYRARSGVGFLDELRIDKAARSFMAWALFGKGVFANQVITGSVLLRTEKDAIRPDIQLIISPVRVDANLWCPGIQRRPDDCFYTAVCLLHPESRGEVRLRSADPRAKPLINLNLLSAEKDRRVLGQGFHAARRIFETEPMASLVADEMIPGAQVQTDEEIAKTQRDSTGIVHHPVGSCAMGNGPAAVVDSELRVRGIDALRVVDASIMPTVPGANTNAAAVMIGEKGADLIMRRGKSFAATRA